MQLHREQPRITEAGARLVIIGNGGPSFIEGFREKSGFQGEIYTDPGRRSYKALHLRRDLRAVLNPRAIPRAVEAYRNGARQSVTRGDNWQQGGVFVFSTSGEMLYSFRSQYAGDHPSIGHILHSL